MVTTPDWPVTTVARLRLPRDDAVLSQPRVGALVSPDPGVRSAMVAASWFPESTGRVRHRVAALEAVGLAATHRPDCHIDRHHPVTASLLKSGLEHALLREGDYGRDINDPLVTVAGTTAAVCCHVGELPRSVDSQRRRQIAYRSVTDHVAPRNPWLGWHTAARSSALTAASAQTGAAPTRGRVITGCELDTPKVRLLARSLQPAGSPPVHEFLSSDERPHPGTAPG